MLCLNFCKHFLIAVLLFGVFAPRSANAQATEPPPTSATPSTAEPSSGTKASRTITVPASQQWSDTGIDVKAGDRLVLSASGTPKFGSVDCDPNGLPRTWKDLMRSLPVNSAGNCALVGRVGDANFAAPFLVGKEHEFVAPTSGRLYLGINELQNESGEGAYKVKVQVQPAAAAAGAKALTTGNAPGNTAPAPVAVNSDVLKGIPTRISDQQNNAGDMVNFLVIGDQEKLKSAFASAGWVLVDRTKNEAILNAALMSLQKKAYVEMPMSELYLFGRPQDFGYAHAEPVQVVASRHHLRIWRAPGEYDGKPVWVGAATHDIGFERDQRTGGVTHKIDADVDQEREFVGSTLEATGAIAQKAYVTPADPLREAHTATGGTFHSDGRVIVLVLR